MAEKNNSLLLKIALIIFTVIALVYGLCYFFVPDFLVKLSGGEPVYHGWLRWPGGVLIALGIGSIFVLREPQGQGIFVITIALGCLLSGLALLYAWITLEEGAAVWFTAVPTIGVLALSCLLWWGRSQAKDIL